MTDPNALLASLVGGIAALAAIIALRPRRQRVVMRQDERRAARDATDSPHIRNPRDRNPADRSAPMMPQRVSTRDPVESIVREITHSLNTPLAQIEATILALEVQSEEQKRAASGVLDATQICKSFLAAFREVASVSRDAGAWEPASLSHSLKAAANVYGNRVRKEFQLQIDMPDRLPEYDNNYVLAILLPILENAIEAVTRNGNVEMVGLPQKEANVISIGNDTVINVLSDRIYEPDFTTKPGHSGFGLAVVRRLVEARPDASVRHDLENGRVICVVKLPRRL